MSPRSGGAHVPLPRVLLGLLLLALPIGALPTGAGANSPPPPSGLPAGHTLRPTSTLVSPDRHFRLLLQTDGNLVEFTGSQPVWASGTPHHPDDRLTMQADGNLVLLSPQNQVLWVTNTSGHPRAHLQLLSGGDLIVESAADADLWSSDTHVPSSSTGTDLVTIATSQDQHGAKIVESPPNSTCNPYTPTSAGTSCRNGWHAEAWCADFVAWDWRRAGLTFPTGSSGAAINAWSASFYFWGVANHHWHALSSPDTPKPGDVAVYGNLTEAPGPGHVGIYVTGPAHDPTVVNGNWGIDSSNSNFGVIEQIDEATTGVAGGVLKGWVTPP